MQVSSTPGTPPPPGSGSARSSRATRDQFMQLLLAQVRNQNPLEPLKESEFMGQLAQFSMLEGIETLNTTFKDMLTLQQLTQGSNLIGRTITFDAGSGSLRRGVVESVAIEDGMVFLQVGGVHVPLEFVRGVEQTPR